MRVLGVTRTIGATLATLMVVLAGAVIGLRCVGG